jgi:hypothetical protein
MTDPSEKCLKILRVAITEAGQASVVLGERTVDEYLAGFSELHAKAGALIVLKQCLTKDWRATYEPGPDSIPRITIIESSVKSGYP